MAAEDSIAVAIHDLDPEHEGLDPDLYLGFSKGDILWVSSGKFEDWCYGTVLQKFDGSGLTADELDNERLLPKNQIEILYPLPPNSVEIFKVTENSDGNDDRLDYRKNQMVQKLPNATVSILGDQTEYFVGRMIATGEVGLVFVDHVVEVESFRKVYKDEEAKWDELLMQQLQDMQARAMEKRQEYAARVAELQKQEKEKVEEEEARATRLAEERRVKEELEIAKQRHAHAQATLRRDKDQIDKDAKKIQDDARRVREKYKDELPPKPDAALVRNLKGHKEKYEDMKFEFEDPDDLGSNVDRPGGSAYAKRKERLKKVRKDRLAAQAAKNEALGKGDLCRQGDNCKRLAMEVDTPEELEQLKAENPDRYFRLLRTTENVDVFWGGHNYHVECFTCAKCGKTQKKSDVTDHEGHPYCSNCIKSFNVHGFRAGFVNT